MLCNQIFIYVAMSSCRVHVCVSYGGQLCVCEPLCLNAGLLQDAEFIERNLDVLLELMISSLHVNFHRNGTGLNACITLLFTF